MNEITVKLNHIYKNGTTSWTSTKINNLLFADDQVIIADSKDNLQRGEFTLQNKVKKKFGMEISPEKSQTMSFLGQEPVSETIVCNKCLKVKNFKYLGCEISYEHGKDIQQKIAKFTQILRILNNTFKSTLVQIFSRIKVYNALALPNLLYGREI